MYLKRLELQGFKSFPEKIKLDFNTGITAVVGPNGSGKSNISDAVRWVLGEQSARTLRGGKMEDVIFAGTSSRRALGFAEVTMVMDNHDGKIPLEFDEIAVTRRVYRSGESQYVINGTVCRLKDIHELFMDTGIGREGYSIIGQGRIEEILSAKSEDRRLLFEEAAGIVKYKNRRREAEIKLEHEKQNMIRVDDILREIEAQLEPLEKAAEKARMYQRLGEKLKLLRVNIFLQEIKKIESDSKAILTNIEDLESQAKAVEDEQADVKRSTETIKRNAENADRRIEELNKAIYSAKSAAEKKESEILLEKQSIEHYIADKKRLNADINAKEAQIAENGENVRLYEARLSAARIELLTKQGLLESESREFEELSRKLSESEGLIDKYANEHIEKLGKTSDINGRIQRTETLYEQLERRREEIADEKHLAASRLNENETKTFALNKTIAELDEKISSLSRDNDGLHLQRQALETEIASVESELRQSQKKLNEISSRHKLLTELESGYEGYYKSVKSVLKQKNDNPKEFGGICGAVGEIITAGEEYEIAVEIALGGAIQDILTENEDDAQRAIEYLKGSGNGRATFLPLTSIKPKPLSQPEYERVARETGFIKVAVDAVECDGRYRGVMSSLLGRVLIFDTLQNAVAFSRKNNYNYKCVTLTGDVINPGGALTGGSVSKTGTNILSRAREITKLSNTLTALTESSRELTGVLNDKTNVRNSIKDLTNRNKIIIQETELQKASQAAALSQAKSAHEEIVGKKTLLDAEDSRLMGDIVEQNKKLRELKNEREAIEEEIADILSYMDERQLLAAGDKENKESKARELTNIKVEISRLTQTVSGTEDNLSHMGNAVQLAREDIAVFRRNIEDIENEIVKIEKSIDILADEIDDLKAKEQSVSRELEGVSAQKAELRRKLELFEEAAEGKADILLKLSSEKARLEVRKEQLDTENRRIYDEMWDEYNITFQAALQYEIITEPLSKLQKSERELKNDIKDLGSVNLSAIDEYKLLCERFLFMKKQRDDVFEAEEKLHSIITELTGLMEERFREQFDLISKNFGDVFSEMFGGGTAKLRLSNEDDVLSSGIEIVAQMPGKNLQNMSLFSGGERALTAAALLFGILRLKPSPFCILDEIEAALDDANVKRFAEFLKKFKDTQFIVITHRKGTMEAADTLYGVTMQEQGVSKLVSVKFAV